MPDETAAEDAPKPRQAPDEAEIPEKGQPRIAEVITRSRLSTDLIEALKPKRAQSDNPDPTAVILEVEPDRIQMRRIQGELARMLDEASRPPPPPGPAGDDMFAVILEFNNDFPGGARLARAQFLRNCPPKILTGKTDGAGRELLAIAKVGAASEPPEPLELDHPDRIHVGRSAYTDHYLFADLSRRSLERLAGLAEIWKQEGEPLIYKIWLDRTCEAFIDTSYRTIKCDAGQAAFAARGDRIVWAVADTGIQGDHPHFRRHGNLAHDLHRDFTDATGEGDPLIDTDGHGTHVAGILAGECIKDIDHDVKHDVDEITAQLKRRLQSGDQEIFPEPYDRLSGIAPLTKLVSLKVLESRSRGRVSMLIAALGYIQQLNEHGRNIRIHGVNLSVGYAFDPEWFAAGQSPVCQEVDRLVNSGVVVVVAAGNGGYGTVLTLAGGSERAAHASTIADPGNAALAITVGSTHRDRPHEYGVSYFSAKGPTADGRAKPDLVAPGERIISCAIGSSNPRHAHYREETGTSMAAPHVSGAIAAFLSVRSEFIGKPRRIKELFMANATDLGRCADFQGRGLIDLMRTLQAV